MNTNFIFNYLSLVALLLSLAHATRPRDYGIVERRQASARMVFCHFMIGIVSNRMSAGDYDDDMTRAKSAGIDAFALNIGTDSFTDQQLKYAYESAAKNGMKVFISFDFNWWNTSQTSEIGTKIKQYGSRPAQLKVGSNGDQVFVSSFEGDALNVSVVRSAAGMPLFMAPNFQPSSLRAVDGALNWMGWPNNGDNKAPSAGHNVTVSDGDNAYIGALSGKPYIAPVSAWFSTHYGSEVAYSKNWVFPSDLLWYNRWMEILRLAPQYVEIITWNDYGESHYIGPLSSPHYDDGNSKWTNDMPHDGWLEMAKPFIAAFKAGSTSVTSQIKRDQIFYWYRPTLKSASCSSTDNTIKPADNSTGNFFQGIPNGADGVTDSIFVVAFLIEAGQVHISSGSNSKSFNGQAGANAWAVDMGTGKQAFSLTRSGSTVLSGTSLKDISADCICGIYNFNAYVGSLPANEPDSLQSPDGYQEFISGLSPGICEPTPSLGTALAASAAPISSASVSNPFPSSSMGSVGSASAAPEGVSAVKAVSSSVKRSETSLSATATGPSSVTKPTITTKTATGGNIVTALSQLYPTNCMQLGQIWAGPAGADPPARCDGS